MPKTYHTFDVSGIPAGHIAVEDGCPFEHITLQVEGEATTNNSQNHIGNRNEQKCEKTYHISYARSIPL